MKFKRSNITQLIAMSIGFVVAGFCFTSQVNAQSRYSADEVNSIIENMYASQIRLESHMQDTNKNNTASIKGNMPAYDVSHEKIIDLMKKEGTFYNNDSENNAAPTFSNFKTERMIQNRENSDSLCDILADPSFKMVMPDWSKIEDAWNSFTAAAAAKTKGINFSAVMNLITKKAMDKLWGEIKEGTCKMTQKVSRSVNHSINSAYEKVKQKGIDTVIDSGAAQQIGLSSLDESGLKNIAQKETAKQLNQYDSYGHWYEKGYFSDKNMSNNIDDIINKQINKSKEKIIDKVAPKDKSIASRINENIESTLDI